MKHEKYLTILLVICFLSYFMMVNLSMTAGAEDLSDYQVNKDVNKRDALIYTLRNSFLEEKMLTEFTHVLTNLDYSDCEFIINECKSQNLDPFIILGIIKKESDFDPNAKGAAGERGLGQLMENTARPVAENLGYVYDADKLFDARYNLKLTITQLSYLMNIYGNDVHKALTAYNRGQKGLEEYMKHSEGNSAVSDYSVKVVKLAEDYRVSFNK
jgi:hypothetical protein